MRVRNTWLLYYVHDMNRAKEFYMKSFHVEPLKETDGWTELAFGSMILALHTLPAHGAGTMPHAGLIVQVDSLDEVQADIERYGGRLVEKRDPKYLCFEDSEGNGFELC